ncbi:MAG TPA: glucose 1-dehydrogenase [Acidimicrobiales bacterium]|nr:glucose 1-dehydrogenase [Acidimicrobiales bacterium]
MTALGSAEPLAAFNLKGHVALITGGSRGLGRAMSWGFARNGATVVVASRDGAACKAIADEIHAEGHAAVGIACHVGEWEQCATLVDQIYERFDRIDVLVNNAGMSPLYPSLVEVTEALFDKVMAVNLKGPFRLSALVGTRMAQGQGGSIINISSIAAVEPRPIELPYAAAKAGLNCLTAGFSRAFGPTVRVNGIMAGPFMTDVTKSWDLEAFAVTAADQISLRRGGEPEEIVGAALYLASEASSYTTGAVIKVDGGAARATG